MGSLLSLDLLVLVILHQLVCSLCLLRLFGSTPSAATAYASRRGSSPLTAPLGARPTAASSRMCSRQASAPVKREHSFSSPRPVHAAAASSGLEDGILSCPAWPLLESWSCLIAWLMIRQPYQPPFHCLAADGHSNRPELELWAPIGLGACLGSHAAGLVESLSLSDLIQQQLLLPV